jgi:tRNA pseudouridine38-40 synthase
MSDSKVLITEDIALANYRVDICYDGRNYYGWQRPKDNPTNQGAIEAAVADCFGVRQNLEGSGRTDRGAHALGQVASIRLPKDLDEEESMTALNRVLNDDIKITGLKQISDDFHARESAIGKQYLFKIWNNPELPPEMDGKVWYVPEKLNLNVMQKACSFFVGMLDYTSFAKVPNFKRATSVRTVYSMSIKQDGSMQTFSIIADGFLYKMVRNIVRAIVKVGEGRTPLKEIPRIIDAKNRKAAPGTAPASGLYLDSVFYDQKSLDAAVETNRKEKI